MWNNNHLPGATKLQKIKYQGTCPCSDIEFRLVYEADEEKQLFCPFCSVPIEELDEEFEDE